jgi:hypothetical protein
MGLICYSQANTRKRGMNVVCHSFNIRARVTIKELRQEEMPETGEPDPTSPVPGRTQHGGQASRGVSRTVRGRFVYARMHHAFAGI